MNSPAAGEEAIDTGVSPVLGVLYEEVLKPVEVQRLLGKATYQPGLQEGGPGVLEKPSWAAFVHLEGKTFENKDSHMSSLLLFIQYCHICLHIICLQKCTSSILEKNKSTV